MRRAHTSLTCTILLTVTFISLGSTVALGAESKDVDQFIQLATKYLQDRAERVTDQAAALGLGNSSQLTVAQSTDGFRQATSNEVGELSRLRSMWSGTDSELSGAKVTLLNTKAIVGSTSAQLTFTELTDLHFAHRRTNDSPPSTSYRVDHTLNFSYSNKKWMIASDVLELPRGSIDPIPYVHPVKRGDLAAPATLPKRHSVPAGLTRATPQQWATRKASRGKPATTSSAPYSRAEVALYAQRWALDRNPSYPDYGNDCANFASQALLAGGWDMANITYNTADAWWLVRGSNNEPLGNSDSWSVADNQMIFGQLSGRLTNYVGEPVYFGDLLFADWDDGNGGVGHDGRIDHSMVVSKVTDPWDWNQIYLSYHTNDTLNITMNQLYYKGGGDAVYYYFFRLNDSQ